MAWGALAVLAAGGVAAYYLLRGKQAEGEEAAPTPEQLVAQEEAFGFDWPTVYRIVGSVGERSNGYGALNLNDRGNGISFGFIQHNQASGSLGKMLNTWKYTDPQGYARVWGDYVPDPNLGERLVESTNGATKADRLRLNLAVEPYLSRWPRAGREPGCQAAQAYEARRSYLTPSILDAAAKVGLNGTRAIGLIFDRSVNQGPGAALTALGRVGAGLPAGEVARGEAALIDFQNACLDLAGQDAAAVLARLERVDAALKASGVA